MYEAFQGANGWYVAYVRKDGFHRQPSFGGNLSEREARRQVKNLNSEDDSRESDIEGDEQ